MRVVELSVPMRRVDVMGSGGACCAIAQHSPSMLSTRIA